MSWLHLSDLHLKNGADQHDQQFILSKLIEFVRSYCHVNPLDFIFVTGDIAYSGLRNQYAAAEAFFHELLVAAKLGPDPSRLFLVPGNHDVDWNAAQLHPKTFSDAKNASAFFGGHDGFARGKDSHWARQKIFVDWLQEYTKRSLAARSQGTCDVYHTNLSNGLAVGILCVNSALFCKRGNDKGKLWVGLDSNLLPAVKRLDEIDPDVRIALIHHPMTWLHPAEGPYVLQILQEKCDFVLHGHEHEYVPQVVSDDQTDVQLIESGACFQGIYNNNLVNIVDVDLECRRLHITPVYFPLPAVLNAEETIFGQRKPALRWIAQFENASMLSLKALPHVDLPLPPHVLHAPSLIGRDAQAGTLCNWLRQDSTVVAYGREGIGTSALAHRVVADLRDDFGGRVALVDCETNRDIESVLSHCAAAILGRSMPITDAATLAEQLSAIGPCLLVFDNVRDNVSSRGLIRGLRELVRSLHGLGPHHAVLIVCNYPVARLGRLFEIAPLSEADASDFFIASARIAGQSHNRRAARAAVAATGPFPLVIQLVAALQPATLPLFRSPISYQSAIEAALMASLKELGDEGQRLVARFCWYDTVPDDLVNKNRKLVDECARRFLLYRAMDRYSIHLSIRRYLRLMPLAAEYREQVLDDIVERLERSAEGQHVDGPQAVAEIISSALEFASGTNRTRGVRQSERLLRIAVAAARYLEVAGPWSLAEEIQNAALVAASRLKRDNEVAHVSCNLGLLYEKMGRSLDQARSLFQITLKQTRKVDDHAWAARAHLGLGHLAYGKKRFKAAVARYEAALEAARSVNEPFLEVVILISLGTTLAENGQLPEAISKFIDADRLARDARAGMLSGAVQNNLGIAFKLTGDLQRAKMHFRESLSIKRPIADRVGTAITLANIAEVELQMQHALRAFALLRDADRLLRAEHAPLEFVEIRRMMSAIRNQYPVRDSQCA